MAMLKRLIFSGVRGRLNEVNRWRLDLLKATYAQTKTVGPYARLCNLCGYEGYFQPFGWPIRPEARCPQCESLERHRLFRLWTDKEKGRFDQKRVLHFAPEPSLVMFIRPGAAEYLTADIEPGKADRVLNIEQLDLADNSFDLIICSHVLEHVDDRVALRELFRVLAPGGLVVLMTPVIEGWTTTYENPDVRTDDERILHFLQSDHVRLYGADVRDRIRTAGFALSEFVAVEPFVHRHALVRGGRLFFAAKPVLGE